jgi:hypothetical protein
MSVEQDPLELLTDQYHHRNPGENKHDFNAERILEGYLEHQGIENTTSIDSEFPYQAALGRTADLEGEIMMSSRYTFPHGDSYAKASSTTGINVENTDETLEEIIPGEAVIDASGAEINSAKRSPTPDGGSIDVDSVHCIVFYDEPVMNRQLIKQEKFQGLAHKKAAMDSLNEPSVATALVTSGREKAGVQVDYWTRTFDGIDDGLDYGELDWSNPGEV